MRILGIGTGVVHDSSACLLEDGRIVGAAEEERFTRKKHQEGYPEQAVAWCLAEGHTTLAGLDAVAIHFRPWRKAARSVALYAAAGLGAPARSAYYIARELSPKLLTALETRRYLRRRLRAGAVLRYVDHHTAHAASAFFVSPFEEAAYLTLDNRGEHESTTWGVGRGHRLEKLGGIGLPHSLGLVYAAFTGRYLGFGSFDEYKVMGLAAYGKPRHLDFFRRLVPSDESGRFRVESRYFDYVAQGVLGEAVHRELGPPRDPEAPIEERHADVAASLQARLEEVAIGLARALQRSTGLDRLCLAGGVALNGVMNAKLLEHTPFRELYIQPAASDGGASLGAALHVYHHELGLPRTGRVMEHAALGPAYTDREIAAELAQVKAPHKYQEDIAGAVAERLAAGSIVGWFQGRMEWGPRALGQRSILADPRRAEMRDRVNRSVKYREEFRPFAPAVLAERAAEYFEPALASPFMLLVVRVRPEKRGEIPAVTHVDGTARVQTVERRLNPLLHEVIEGFARRTGVPVVLNTSFNVKGEPIVRTPLEAVRCFYGSGLDCLAIGSYLVEKAP